MMQNKYGLVNIDGDKEIDDIYEEIESKISEYLNKKKNGIVT